MKRPVCLIIRDGWGNAKESSDNAIHLANTPRCDDLKNRYPYTSLYAHGEHVGLVDNNQGNSEVGHLNIGAGRVVYQSLKRISNAINDNSFFENKVLNKAIDNCIKNNSTLHLMGLVQDQGVHAVTNHCIALLELCQKKNFNNVIIHAFTDGRDTPPKSAEKYLLELQKGIDKYKTGRIATIIGRYYVMDRDNRWDRIEIAYNCLIQGDGVKVNNWKHAIEDAYNNNETDEFIKPRVIDYSGINDKDSIIFFNYRLDRARQITHAFTDNHFDKFERVKKDVFFAAFTNYYESDGFEVAFGPIEMNNILGEYLSKKGYKQLRCAETEKYAHVTFFFNGQKEEPYSGEDRILVNSPNVETYDMKPEMSAFQLKDKVIEAIEKDIYDVIIINFANCDMVGHTGIPEAIIKAVETVDRCTGEVCDAVLKKNGSVIVTADHGNAEQIRLSDGSPMTAHTINNVELILVSEKNNLSLKENGSLSDIAPTIIDLLGDQKPQEMTGDSLIIRK